MLKSENFAKLARLGGKTSIAVSMDTPPIESGARILTLSNEGALLGPLSVEDYRRYTTAHGNDSDYALKKIADKFCLVDNSAGPQARAAMWTRYSALLELIDKSDSKDTLKLVKDFVLSNNPIALEEFKEPRGLAAHLIEIEKFCFDFLLTDQMHSKLGESILPTRHAQLLTYVVAPLHDLLKYMGTPQSQVVPDHEIMAAELVRRTFSGKSVSLGSTSSTLSNEDVAFISGVIGDHENLEKELGRSKWILSPDPIEKAKAIFSVMDTLTASLLVSDNGKTWLVDPIQLHKRFTNLYFRHMDLEAGKIFRPEWGLHAIADLSFTLTKLGELGPIQIRGITVKESIKETLTLAALEAIDAALTENGLRATSSTKTFSAEQFARIENARSLLTSELVGSPLYT